MTDGRERLRRYLEQRRELGEREFVLDSLSVEDALRTLGAGGTAPARTAGTADSAGSAGAAKRARAETAPTPPKMPVDVPNDPAAKGTPAEESGDWRATLRSTGAAPAPSVPLAAPLAASPPPASPPGAPPPAQATTSAVEPPTARPGPPASADSLGDLAPRGVAAPGGAPASDPRSTLADLSSIAASIASCTRCPLYATATNPVPGEGNPDADLVFVGEAPGATEDATGRPFVGAAGQLLTKIIQAIDLERSDVFIVNVLKHRPPGNRNPMPDEVVACSPFLVRQIALIRPKVIVALGTFAAQTLLETKLSIGKLRGQIHRYQGVPVIVTYHPAALLRNPAWKRPTWEDVQLARRILDRAASGA